MIGNNSIKMAFEYAIFAALEHGVEQSSLFDRVCNLVFGNLVFETHTKDNISFGLNRASSEKPLDFNDDKENIKEPTICACFAANEWVGFRQCSVGTNTDRMMFINHDKQLYVVDTLSIGALYVFQKEENARNWATHRISYLQARKLAEFWTPHYGGWEQRVQSVMLHYY